MVHARSSTHFWLMLLLAMKTNGVDLDITLIGDPLTGTAITLTCNIPSFSQAAVWKNPVLSSGVIQSCSSGFCLATNPSYPGYTFSTNASAFTIVIASADLDDNIWTCEHDTGTDSGTKNLDLKVPPTTCNLVESGGIYTCTSSCGYPANDMSIRAKLNGTSNTQDLTSLTAVSAPACTSPESAYSANVPTSFFTKSTDLYCECGVSGFESSFVQSNAVAVTATTTTPASSSSSICDSCTTTNVLAALGIVVAVVCVALCWIMFFQLSGKLQDLDSALIKSKCSVKQTLIAAIIATSLCVIGIILCIVALVTVAIALAVVGLVLPVVTLVIVIILLTFFCRGKDGDDDYIKILKTSYAITEGTTFTIPCSASSAASAATATSFSWERTIDGRTSPIRIDGAHFSEVTTGSPSLTIINASITDSGTYTCVASNSAGTARASTQLTVSKHNSPNLGDDTTEECVALNSDPLLEEKANNPI